MKILIVDDNDSFLMAISNVIRDWGADVDCADNADDAIELSAATNYDLILLDLRMPNHDGLWFARHVKNCNKTKIVLMSGFIPVQVANRLSELGINDYLLKPFNVEDLLERFAVYCRP